MEQSHIGMKIKVRVLEANVAEKQLYLSMPLGANAFSEVGSYLLMAFSPAPDPYQMYSLVFACSLGAARRSVPLLLSFASQAGAIGANC